MSSSAGTDAIGTGNRDPNEYPIDPSRYSLEGTDLEFWQTHTGIQDEEELKKHILKVQAEAYAVFSYQCIRNFLFTKPRVVKVPQYDQLVKLGRERNGTIFLEAGCCFGTDARKVAVDGWPAANIVATDIHPEFWELGHKLFRSSKETFPATFIPGNLVDPTHLEVVPALSALPEGSAPPRLTNLTSLNPLRGHVSVIHAGALFHLFTEEQQTQLARAFAGLLSPLPGSMIVGSHCAAIEKPGLYAVMRGKDSTTISQFHHTRESWMELWDGEVFEKGTVKVDVNLFKMNTVMPQTQSESEETIAFWSKFLGMTWSVTRL